MLTAGLKPHSHLQPPHPRRTRIPPCLTRLFDDYGSILLPARFWTDGAGLHPLIPSEIKAFWGLRFPLPRVLGDEILCTNTLGVINQALRAGEVAATTTTGVRRKPFVFLWEGVAPRVLNPSLCF